MSTHLLAANQSLRLYFQSLTAFAIQQKTGIDIYQKGLNYYENDAVEDLEATDASTVVADVYGSDNYEVKIFARSGKVQAKCTCPYDTEWGDLCKHVAAVLIKAVEEEFWQEIPAAAAEAVEPARATGKPSAAAGDRFETWLGSLSEEELRQTVRKLASPAFREEIKLRHSSQGDREEVFLDTKKKILKSFKRLGKYDGGQDFDVEIAPLLEKLKGVWVENAEEVKDLFLKIIEAVNEAQDDGSLFEEYSEESYDGSELMGWLADFLSELPDAKRLAFLPVFWEALEKDGYDSFSGFFEMPQEYLKPADWGALKHYLVTSKVLSNIDFAKKVHEIFEPAMTPTEKEEWLKNQAEHSDRFVVPLAQFYEKEKGDTKKAAKTLDRAIEKILSKGGIADTSKQILEERIRLAQAQKEGLEILAEQYVSILPQAESLQRALSLAPGRRQSLEALLRSKSISQFLIHLESEKRLDEVVNILESNKKEPFQSYGFGFSSGFSNYDFYARNKKELPEKALACFRKRLDEQLPSTGDNYYRAVVDVLKNMKALLPEAEFRSIVSNIRLQYARRRNLMDMLNREFKR